MSDLTTGAEDYSNHSDGITPVAGSKAQDRNEDDLSGENTVVDTGTQDENEEDSSDKRIVVDTTMAETVKDQTLEEDTTIPEKRVTRSIHFDKDPYDGVNPNKNDAEGDYEDVELPVKTKLTRPRQIIIPDETTMPMTESTPKTSSLDKVTQKHSSSLKTTQKPVVALEAQVNKTEERFVQSEPHNWTQLEDARLLKQIREMALMSWDSSTPPKSSKVPANAIAVHLVGDTSKYKQIKEKHYDVNNRMYHPKGYIKDWKIDTQVAAQDGTEGDFFQLESGHLKVKEAGLYFVYAQIYYSTKEDTSGFNIFLNDNVMMRCITTGLSSEQLESSHSTAPNSCYTGGLMRIARNDKLSIKETQGERFTIFEPTRSFFGLFKVG